MTKTLALLLDSYRELNAKRLFWIVLVLSGLVVGVFAMLGIKGDTITILWFKTPLRGNFFAYFDPASLYKSIFIVLGIGVWLTWIANALALVSTAGTFPDFLAAGSIDLYLAKPISRLRLFISKWAGGLLFVTLQVSIFSLCCFLVLGLRAHEWNPRIFLAIPIVVLVFSYLFSICVLVGVLTRSTVAALLVTLLIWFGLWAAQATEAKLLQESIFAKVNAASLDRQIIQTRSEIDRLLDAPTTSPATPSDKGSFNPLHFLVHRHDDLQSKLQDLEKARRDVPTSIQTWHRVAYAVITILPKTSGTNEVLTRQLSTDQANQAVESLLDEQDKRRDPRHRQSPADRKAVRLAMQEDESKRTATWFIGTSLGFELVMLSIAATIFCRRDY